MSASVSRTRASAASATSTGDLPERIAMSASRIGSACNASLRCRMNMDRGRPRFLALRQEQCLQVGEKAPSELGGTQPLRIGVEQSAAHRFRDRARDQAERVTGALLEQARRHAGAEAQRVQHELEADFVTRDARRLLQRIALRDAIEILARLLPAQLALDAIGMRDLG